ncbi:MAG: glycosyltransferase [Ferruginibacter sp.]
MADKKNIVYLGCSGFPHGLAEIQKIILISKAVILKGSSVTVICKRGMHDKNSRPDMKAKGNFEGIEYIYTPGTPFREPAFLKRNYLKAKGVVNEIKLLRRLSKNNQLDAAILSTHSYYAVLYYFILSKIFGFKTLLNYVEFYSGLKKNWRNADKWLNDELFDRFAPKLTDGSLIISEFLIAHLKKISPQKKYLKLPNLTDVRRYDGIECKEGDEYFLFCGAAGYFEIIKFIVDSFEKLKNTTAFLYLVINGHEFDKEVVKKYIAGSSCRDRIRYLTRLTDDELSSYYLNAIALLIPLRPTLQDTARFPHKIGEYLASGSPVISTNYAEVKYYFRDKENMLIAESYDIGLFTEKMQSVLDEPAEAEKIGNNGKQIAFSQFDYRENGEKILKFIDELSAGKKTGALNK